MTWPVYTETFVRMTAQGVWVRYTVPSGKRAVVTSIQVVGFTVAGGLAAVEIGGVYLLSTPPLAQGQALSYSLRAVAYQGQQISGLTQSQPTHLTISGYLFSTTGQLADEPLDVERELYAELEQLPWGPSVEPLAS